MPRGSPVGARASPSRRLLEAEVEQAPKSHTAMRWEVSRTIFVAMVAAAREVSTRHNLDGHGGARGVSPLKGFSARGESAAPKHLGELAPISMRCWLIPSHGRSQPVVRSRQAMQSRAESAPTGSPEQSQRGSNPCLHLERVVS